MAIILVVDDEVGIRELLSEILIDEGYDVRLAENATAARLVRNELRPDLVLLDIWMPDTDGISLLKEWHAAGHLNMPVVMMSGHGTIDTAVEATRFGAFDFLEKPIALQKLLSTVQKALKHDKPLAKPALTLESFTRSAFVKEFKRRLEQAASKSPVLLIKGANGGMAEICARTLQPLRAPWLDLSEVSSALTQDMLEKISGGILYVPDLAVLGKMQQMNLLGGTQLGSRIDRGEQFRDLGRHRDGGDRNVGVRSRRIHERNRLIGDRFGGMNIQREQRSGRYEQQPTHGNPFLVFQTLFYQ